ncbi:MAG TPA: universal stress protein [Candidatus Acidoferrales bacterium]|nr:universal stress protein [Candidatus Acidoferrales bacterium]
MNVLPMPTASRRAVGLRSILVATDASPDAHVALGAATDLAKRSGAQLHLVTAYNLPAAAVYAYSGYFASDEPADPFEADALAILEKEQVRVESLGGRVAALHTGTGPTFDVIERVADEVDADLIVVGSRDIGGLHRLLAGSVSTSVLHTTHRPVLIVRGGEGSWPPARLVVGVDRSRESKRAALVAASIAGLYTDSVVELLEVLPDPLAPTAHYFNLDSELAVEHEHLDALAESLEHVTGRAVSAATAFGTPADALLARGEDQTGPNLLVVGTRGLGGMRRLFLGSVSTRILHSGHKPVLVVPADGDGVAAAAAPQ